MGISRAKLLLISKALLFIFVISAFFVTYSIHQDVTVDSSDADYASVEEENEPEAPSPVAEIEKPMNPAQLEYLMRAKDALGSSNLSFFKTTIKSIEMNVYKALIEMYLDTEPVKPRRSLTIADPADEKFDQGPAEISTKRNPIFLPPHFHRPRQFLEIAGRGKEYKTKRIALAPLNKSARTVAQYGEDCAGASASGRILVLADGVGSSDAAHLASNAAVSITLGYFERHPEADIIQCGYGLVEAIVGFYNMVAVPGSTTLTIAQICGNVLKVGSIGDSFCSITSNHKMVFQSMPREFKPNCPFQISARTESVEELMFGYRIGIQPGDIIYLYSDGVGDNLWPSVISKITDAAELAAKTVELFINHLTYNIPFKTKSNKGDCYPGKKDDVSVIIRRIES